MSTSIESWNANRTKRRFALTTTALPLIATLCVVGLVTTAISAAHAQTLGIDTGSGGDIDQTAHGTEGWTFVVGSTPVAVTSLGIWNFQSAGLSTDHVVGLWNAAGTLLASTTITNSSIPVASNGSYGSWLFNNITAVNLTAGATYTLGAYFPQSGLGDDTIYDLTNAATDSRITYSSAVADSASPLSSGSSATGLTMPTIAQPYAERAWFGPNLRLSAVGAAAAPEPGSIALLALSGLPVVTMIARRKRRQANQAA